MSDSIDDNDFEEEDEFPFVLAMWDVLDDVRDYCIKHDLKIKTVFDIEIQQNEMGGFDEKYNIFAVPVLPPGPSYDKHFRALNKLIKEGLAEILPDTQIGIADVNQMVQELNGISNNRASKPQKIAEEKTTPKNGRMSFARLLELGDKDVQQ